MVKIVVYSVCTLVLLMLNFVNRAKIRRNFNLLGIEQIITLNDADLNPVLKLDDECAEKMSSRKKAAIELQKNIILTSIYIGLHTILVLALFYDISYLNIGSIISIGLFMGITYVVYVVSKFIFMYGLADAARAVTISPGHSVPGKSFFYFNPLFGYRYFAYSKQLDDRFGLLDNKEIKDTNKE